MRDDYEDVAADHPPLFFDCGICGVPLHWQPVGANINEAGWVDESGRRRALAASAKGMHTHRPAQFEHVPPEDWPPVIHETRGRPEVEHDVAQRVTNVVKDLRGVRKR